MYPEHSTFPSCIGKEHDVMERTESDRPGSESWLYDRKLGALTSYLISKCRSHLIDQINETVLVS